MPTLKSVKTAIIISKMIAHEVFLKKNNFRFTESLKLMCFKGKTMCVKYNIKKSHGPAFRFLGKPRFGAYFCLHIFDTSHSFQISCVEKVNKRG